MIKKINGRGYKIQFRIVGTGRLSRPSWLSKKRSVIRTFFSVTTDTSRNVFMQIGINDAGATIRLEKELRLVSRPVPLFA